MDIANTTAPQASAKPPPPKPKKKAKEDPNRVIPVHQPDWFGEKTAYPFNVVAPGWESWEFGITFEDLTHFPPPISRIQALALPSLEDKRPDIEADIALFPKLIAKEEFVRATQVIMSILCSMYPVCFSQTEWKSLKKIFTKAKKLVPCVLVQPIANDETVEEYCLLFIEYIFKRTGFKIQNFLKKAKTIEAYMLAFEQYADERVRRGRLHQDAIGRFVDAVQEKHLSRNDQSEESLTDQERQQTPSPEPPAKKACIRPSSPPLKSIKSCDLKDIKNIVKIMQEEQVSLRQKNQALQKEQDKLRSENGELRKKLDKLQTRIDSMFVDV